MLSRKYYTKIAAVLSEEREWATSPQKDEIMRDVAISLADYFVTDNPNFDRERFLTACGAD